MTDLISLGADVAWPDHDRATAVRTRLTSGVGLGTSLGALAALAEWVAGVHPGEPGMPFTAVRALVLGAEPGPGLAPAAESQGVSVRVITDLPDEPSAALQAGVDIVDAEVERGTDLLVLAVPGLGADAALAVSVLTNTEPVKVLSRGAAATDPDAWMALAVQVRDRRVEAVKHRDSADQLLQVLGSARLAMAAGIVLRAAGRRTPVVLDGPTVTAAALLAYEAQPRSVRWWCAADSGPDAVQELALTRLGQHGLLDLGTGLGDGLAGVLTVPLLQAAARLGA